MKIVIPSLNSQRVVEWLAVLALLLVLAGAGWRIGVWSWRVLTPHDQVTALDLSGEVNPSLIATRPWFGIRPVGVAVRAVSRPSGAGLNLLGVFSGGGKPAAIVAIGNAPPLPFVPGETLTDGVVLKSVHPDHIVVLRGGSEERVELPAKGAPAEAKKERKESEE